MKNNTVVIVGRINVGKSTLFNRLTETQKAITSKIPGTTRDRNYGEILWRGKNIKLIDTGGVDIDTLKNSIESLILKKPFKAKNSIEEQIINQTQAAIKESSLVIFLTDGRAGVLPQDKVLAKILKKLKTPTLLVCNKLETARQRAGLPEFYQLGMGEPIPISAVTGSGTGDMLDIVYKKLKVRSPKKTPLPPARAIKVAIVGRPNTGKSSLLNKICGEERCIVSEIPLTTREPQDILITHHDRPILLIDTAGLKRKAKISFDLDKISSQRTIATMKRADIVIFVLESQQTLAMQDLALAGLISDTRAGVIIAANKWDLPEKDEKSGDFVVKYLHSKLPPLRWAPIIFVSAKTGQGIDRVLDLVCEIWDRSQTRLTDEQLKIFSERIQKIKKPYGGEGIQRPRIKKFIQTHSAPLRFTVQLGLNQSLHQAYQNFIVNQLREQFDFLGASIKLEVLS